MTSESTSRLAEIKDRLSSATPGPWHWRGNVDTQEVALMSRGANHRPTVMWFRRWGMQHAKPVFNCPDMRGLMDFETERRVVFEVCPEATERSDPRVYRGNFVAINHPDASLIANAPADIAWLVERVASLEQELVELRGVTNEPQ